MHTGHDFDCWSCATQPSQRSPTQLQSSLELGTVNIYLSSIRVNHRHGHYCKEKNLMIINLPHLFFSNHSTTLFFYQSSKLVNIFINPAVDMCKSPKGNCGIAQKKRKLPNNEEDEQSTARHVRMLFTADELTTSCLFSYLSKAHCRPSVPFFCCKTFSLLFFKSEKSKLVKLVG